MKKSAFYRRLSQQLIHFWYQKSICAYLLLPLAWLFQGLTYVRYCWYTQVQKPRYFSVPVIVVGNITLGGAGKTPVVAWLVHYLRQQGYHPGVVARGYGGHLAGEPVQIVQENSQAACVGDEPLLLARKLACPLVVGKKRVQAVECLLKHTPQVDVIICDDGLQHYALGRKVEIIVMDGTKRLGNGFCLPAGPLRESKQRLQRVDFVLVNGAAQTDEWPIQTAFGEEVFSVNNSQQKCSLQAFVGKTVHAVAGIGFPERFFQMLRDKGIDIISHAFPDHHLFDPMDLDFDEKFPILMTEKDAVKCSAFALQNAWAVPLTLELPHEFGQHLLAKVNNG